MTTIWLACLFAAGLFNVSAAARAPSNQNPQEPPSPTITTPPPIDVPQTPAKPYLERIFDAFMGGVFASVLVKAVDYFFQHRLERKKVELQRQQERVKEKHQLADDISLHFNQFLVLLRDLHEAERKFRQAREAAHLEERLAELDRMRQELKAVLQPVQNVLWQKLDKIRRVFDTYPAQTTYEGFRRWYIDQMERDTILSFGPGSEIIAWRDRILQSLNEEVGGE